MVIPQKILEYQQSNDKLHLNKKHPIGIIWNKIKTFFPDYEVQENLHPMVDIYDNFDSLLIGKDHPSRSTSDTYYVGDKVLRTHTSAHQVEMLRREYDKFLVCGDVYRKDEINYSHYPIFHQIEGVKLCDNPMKELKETLSMLVENLFDLPYRFEDSYFPFTEPSLEISVLWNDKWVEILGAGQIRQEILNNAGITNNQGWAFGMGIERLAMLAFDIPDIRLFWTKDERFHSQFKNGEIVKFKRYSNYPPCYKDISFWANDNFEQNEMFDIMREIAGDLLEDVSLIDTFERGGNISYCYRITYRDINRSLTDLEINEKQNIIREKMEKEMDVELR